MEQGRDAHPILGTTLNTGWVQEGDGVERRRGAEPEKHHSGLRFITMETSWKLYRIRAPEHQIREAAVGRMLAPCGQTGFPGAWGWGEHGAWWHLPPPWLGVSHSKPHPTCYTPSTLSIPLALEKDSNSLAKATSMWDLPPDGCCVVLGTPEQPAKHLFCCVLTRADAGSWSREGERMLGRKAAPNPPL